MPSQPRPINSTTPTKMSNSRSAADESEASKSSSARLSSSSPSTSSSSPPSAHQLQLATRTNLDLPPPPPPPPATHVPPSPPPASPSPSPASAPSLGAVDFIGPSSAVKHLFSLPYASDGDVSVALHALGNGTILLDAGEAAGAGAGEWTGFEKGHADGPLAGEAGPATGRGRRRRQRPRSWTEGETDAVGSSAGEAEEEEERRLQSAQRREGERALLASLSLLLEEEKRQQHEEEGRDHGGEESASQTSHHATIVEPITPTRQQPQLPHKQQQQQQEEQDPRLIPSKHNAIVVSPSESSPSNFGILPAASPSELAIQRNIAHTNPTLSLRGTGNHTPKPHRDHSPKGTSLHTTAGTTNRADPGRNDPRDILSSHLPKPQHYTQHVVPPPNDPRQYVHWKFQDMNLLVASDAVIYGVDRGAVGRNDDGHPDERETTGDRAIDLVGDAETTAESIAIRIADASELRSKMNRYRHHPNHRLRHHSHPTLPESTRQSPQRALPPSSYAEALLHSPTLDGEGSERGDHGDHDHDHDHDTANATHLQNIQLQTCIVPSTGVMGPEWTELGFFLSSAPPPKAGRNGGHAAAAATNNHAHAGGGVDAATGNQSDNSLPVGNNGPTATDGWTTGSTPPPPSASSSSPVCTVLDAYLDNIMANVPQMALLLREHGFIQNIKLMRTEDIPSLMMHPSTLGGDDRGEFAATSPTGRTGLPSHQTSATTPAPIFSPEIVEMNAAMLLRFLKTNCTRENSTYLLHRRAGDANIQLFDISSISQLRQRKWIWWLALCSYRFACRLEQIQANVLSPRDKATRREYRKRQRSLLHNTLNLLEDLADMGGGKHETIAAAVSEHLADTYLWSDGADGDVIVGGATAKEASKPTPWAAASQPYQNVTVDCLNKAHDHLTNGIKKLTPLLAKAKRDESSMEIEAVSMQLYGIHHKMINVCLRLAEHHLQNYFSSNLIHSLRTAARTLSDAASLLRPLRAFDFHPSQTEAESPSTSPTNNPSTTEPRVKSMYAKSIFLQYAWLWEYCGHFARSFAADELWRERGHTCGNDLLSLFREVDSTCSEVMKRCFRGAKWKPQTSVNMTSHGQVTLSSLSGIVVLPTAFEQIDESVLQKEGCHEAISTAKAILDRQTQIKRDERLVLVAAGICYGHAIDTYIFLAERCEAEVAKDSMEGEVSAGKQPSGRGVSKGRKNEKEGWNIVPLHSGAPVAPLLRQRLGDACNEIGKILLNEGRLVLSSDSPSTEVIGISSGSFGMSHVSAIMLASAQFWFMEGLKQFTAGKDLRNIALLRCNLCQCCKIRANANVILPGFNKGDSKECNSEVFLQEAVDHLVLAHETMGQRDSDPMTWDMVSEELAATLLVLGVRRRQSSKIGTTSAEPVMLQALRLTPGAEKAIVEPMERSCKIYESLGTAHAAHQAAAAHYQLALYFSRVWTCQRDESKTREKLAAAFEHFGLAHQYFFRSVYGNEPTFVVLSLDFSNLYSAVSGEECLSKALACCLDCRQAFSPTAVAAALERVDNAKNRNQSSDARAWFEKMTTLAENVEGRVSKLLLSLVKIEKDGGSASSKYKDMYRTVLTHKISPGNKKGDENDEEKTNSPYCDLPSSFPVYDLLESLTKRMSLTE